MRAMIGVTLVLAVLALAGCASNDDSGDTSPNGLQPNGTLNNGLAPENWGETS